MVPPQTPATLLIMLLGVFSVSFLFRFSSVLEGPVRLFFSTGQMSSRHHHFALLLTAKSDTLACSVLEFSIAITTHKNVFLTQSR